MELKNQEKQGILENQPGGMRNGRMFAVSPAVRCGPGNPDGVLPGAGGAHGGPGGPPLRGGAVHFRHQRLRDGVFLRVSFALRILSELRSFE